MLLEKKLKAGMFILQLERCQPLIKGAKTLGDYQEWRCVWY